MREGIAAHGGYEINTEGDAFHIAFTTVAQAVSFAMEAQARHLPSAELSWEDCGKLPFEELDSPLDTPMLLQMTCAFHAWWNPMRGLLSSKASSWACACGCWHAYGGTPPDARAPRVRSTAC